MLTILDFISAGRQLKTACGWEFEIRDINRKEKYPISGFVKAPSGIQMLYRFDEHGYPENLPLTHGLNLVPVINITYQHQINSRTMKEFTSVEDLIASETARILNEH